MNERTHVKPAKRFVAYYRVSTDKQGLSGLGLEAQRNSVLNFLSRENGELHREYTEVESGAEKKRPELKNALIECKKAKAILVIAKLDRLARNVHVISGLIESGVEFVAVDNPHANKLMVHMLAAFAEHEREQIAYRTKSALAAAKRRGVRLGVTGKQRAKDNKDNADAFAAKIAPLLSELRLRGLNTANALSQELNRSTVSSQRGGKWYPMTVSRILARVAKLELKVQNLSTGYPLENKAPTTSASNT